MDTMIVNNRDHLDELLKMDMRRLKKVENSSSILERMLIDINI